MDAARRVYRLTEDGERALDALVGSAKGATLSRLKEPFGVECGDYMLTVPAYTEVSYFCNVDGKGKGAPSATVATFFMAPDLQVSVLRGGFVEVVNPYYLQSAGRLRNCVTPTPHPSGTGVVGRRPIPSTSI